jgi:copper chaperone
MSASETRLRIKGMKCDGCIARAREALSKVPGVVDAEFDLKAGTALVKGNADRQAIAQVLTDTGYPAELESS